MTAGRGLQRWLGRRPGWRPGWRLGLRSGLLPMLRPGRQAGRRPGQRPGRRPVQQSGKRPGQRLGRWPGRQAGRGVLMGVRHYFTTPTQHRDLVLTGSAPHKPPPGSLDFASASALGPVVNGGIVWYSAHQRHCQSMNWITQSTEMAVALTTSAGNVGPLPSFEFVQYALGLQAEIVAAAESPVYLPPKASLLLLSPRRSAACTAAWTTQPSASPSGSSSRSSANTTQSWKMSAPQ